MGYTVSQLDEAYGNHEDYPASGSKAEKQAFAEGFDEGRAVDAVAQSDAQSEPEKAEKQGKYHVLFDSVHFTDSEGVFQQHVTAEHGATVDLPKKEGERLSKLGAVTTSADAAAEFRAARAAAQGQASVGSQVVS